MNVPYDVWFNIAKFLPPWHVENMLSVNRSWFNLAMDARYREIKVTTCDEKMERKLLRLRYPLVGLRVRSLYIRPWYMGSTPPKPSKLRAFADRFLPPRSRKRSAITTNNTIPPQAQKQISIIMDILVDLPNVTEYNLDWAWGPPHQSIFYTPLLQILGPNLQTLSLRVPTSGLPTLLPPGGFGSLELLQLTLHGDSDLSDDINSGVDYLALFVNGLTRLKALIITSSLWSLHLNLSRFFHQMGHFPHLRKFCLCIPPHGTHLPDPSELQSFLNSHIHTLEYLSLTSVNRLPDENSSPDWVEQSLSDIVFRDLQILHVALRPQVDLGTMIGHLHRFANTLSTLALTDRFLSYADLNLVLDALTLIPGDVRLENLDIKTCSLSPEVVDVLADKLPSLRELKLTFLDVVYQEGVDPHNSSRRMFFDEMRKRRYVEWKLRHLELHTEGYVYALSQSILLRLSFPTTIILED